MTTKNQTKTFLGAVALSIVLVVGGAAWYQELQKNRQLSQLESGLKLQSEPEKIISYRELPPANKPAVTNDNPEPMVVYTYISPNPVQAETYKGFTEDTDRRTPSSRTFIISKTEKEEKYISKFYPGIQQAQLNGQWYETKTATTTKSAYLLQTQSTLLTKVKEKILGTKALADNYYVGTGDGEVSRNNESTGTWVEMHEATRGTSLWPTTESMFIRVIDNIYGGYDVITRMFIPIDTSSIASSADINSAVLYFYVMGVTNGDNDGNDFVRLVQTSQATHTTLEASDFNDCGATTTPTGGAADLDITNIVVNTYNSMSLNSTGLSWIIRNGQDSSCSATAGITCLGMREGHDVVDQDFDGLGNSVGLSTSETTGTTQDPYLEVTYVMPPAAVKINGGSIRVNGGKVQVDSSN